MRQFKTVAKLAAGVLVASAALVIAATPASANDEGTQLTGNIYWFNTVGPLADQSPATQITSGSNAQNRPWKTLTTSVACPGASTQMYTYVRIPQNGVPENEWPQIALGGSITEKDAAGRYYSTLTSQADRLNKPEVVAYNAANGGQGTFPFLAVCRDSGGNPLGYFKTSVTISGTTVADLAWSIVSPTCDASSECKGGSSQQPAVNTTTTLVAAASGKDVSLTATVAPAAATGTVTFSDGATTLGTAPVSGGVATFTATTPAPGAHTYKADFAPADSSKYNASTGSVATTVALDAATGQIQLSVPAAPVVDGSLTFSVPFSTPVQLVSARSQDNSRITATAAFPTVTVTDTRRDGLLSHWQVNVQSSDFQGSAGTLGAKYLGWVPASTATPDQGSPLLTRNGASVASFLDDATSSGLATSKMLGESATAGRGSAKLDAALNLAIPPSTAEGQYTATVTVTLVGD